MIKAKDMDEKTTVGMYKIDQIFKEIENKEITQYNFKEIMNSVETFYGLIDSQSMAYKAELKNLKITNNEKIDKYKKAGMDFKTKDSTSLNWKELYDIASRRIELLKFIRELYILDKTMGRILYEKLHLALEFAHGTETSKLMLDSLEKNIRIITSTGLEHAEATIISLGDVIEQQGKNSMKVLSETSAVHQASLKQMVDFVKQFMLQNRQNQYNPRQASPQQGQIPIIKPEYPTVNNQDIPQKTGSIQVPDDFNTPDITATGQVADEEIRKKIYDTVKKYIKEHGSGSGMYSNIRDDIGGHEVYIKYKEYITLCIKTAKEDIQEEKDKEANKPTTDNSTITDDEEETDD